MPGQLSSNNIRLLIQWSSGQAPLEVTFFVAVKKFHANIANIANFVLIVKNSYLEENAVTNW